MKEAGKYLVQRGKDFANSIFPKNCPIDQNAQASGSRIEIGKACVDLAKIA